MTSPIQQLRELGQSLWLDNIRRQLITSGELARLRDEGLTGVTSNPTIFDKAVSGSTDYDEALVRMVGAGQQPADPLSALLNSFYSGADSGAGSSTTGGQTVSAASPATRRAASAVSALWGRAGA